MKTSEAREFKVGDEVYVAREGQQCIYPGRQKGRVARLLPEGWVDVELYDFAMVYYEAWQLDLVKGAP